MHIAVFAAFSSFASGAMPSVQSGGLTVVLCTGVGPVRVTLDDHGEPIDDRSELCAWSLHAPLADFRHTPPDGAAAEFLPFVPAPPHSILATAQDRPDQNRQRGPPLDL